MGKSPNNPTIGGQVAKETNHLLRGLKAPVPAPKGFSGHQWPINYAYLKKYLLKSLKTEFKSSEK